MDDLVAMLSDKSEKYMDLYQFDKKIGTGSYATVWRARHRLSNQQVAIKVYEKKKKSGFNIRHELEALERIDHPSIVRFYELIETKNRIMLVMEYCPGQSLAFLISDQHRLEESVAKCIFKQLIDAITYLHSRGVVHRDIKPENIIIDRHNDVPRIKLIDFGFSTISTVCDSDFCGTPAFIAPEILSGTMYTTRPVDVWSAGILLYQMVVGQVPFHATTKHYLYKKIALGKYSIPKWVSTDLRQLLSQLLVLEVEKRARADEIRRHNWLSTDETDVLDTRSSFFVAKGPIDKRIMDMVRLFVR